MYAKKSCMVLVEVLFAVTLCAVLMGLCIYVFKTKDITHSTFIYSLMNNLEDAHSAVIEDCYKTGGCENLNELPDSVTEYCVRLANNLITEGSINCSQNTTFTGASSKTYINNFRLSNGVALYDLNKSAWKTLTVSTGVTRKYIDAFLDINGKDKGENALSKDIFAIRIFKNGEVVPSYASGATVQAYNDEEFFAFKMVLNRAKSDNENARVEETINANGALSGKNTLQDNKPREAVSFREGICRTNPSLLNRYYTGGDSGELSTINCTDYADLIAVCDFSSGPYSADKSAFCKVEPLKPRGNGILKLLGI